MKLWIVAFKATGDSPPEALKVRQFLKQCLRRCGLVELEVTDGDPRAVERIRRLVNASKGHQRSGERAA